QGRLLNALARGQAFLEVPPPEQEAERNDATEHKPGSERNTGIRVDARPRPCTADCVTRRPSDCTRVALRKDASAGDLRHGAEGGCARWIGDVLRICLPMVVDALARLPDVD